ncbi:MAG: sensor histidine kinase [bacterium]
MKFIALFKLVEKSLAFKLILCIGIILIISLSLFFYLKNSLDRKIMVDQIKREAYLLSDIIKRSIYHDMLRASRGELQESFEIIGMQEDVKKVRIIERGRIKMSSYKHEIGMKVNQEAESCYDCHKTENKKPITLSRYRFFITEEGEPVLGFVNPIHNEKECRSCHAGNNDVLGILDIVLSMEKVYKTMQANQKCSLLFIFNCFLLIAVSIGLFILRFVNKPIKELAYSTRRITQGDFEYHIHNNSEDEIGELAKSFNRMTDNLRRFREQLLHAKEYIHNILKSMKDALIVVNPDGRIKTVNQATLSLLNYDNEEDLVGQPVKKIFGKDTPFSKDLDFTTLITGNSIRNYDTIFKTKQGNTIPINLSASIMDDKEGNLFAVVYVARDMTEIQKLIHDLKQTNKDLHAAQAQLIQASKLASMGELAAGVAHEINNPIAIILLNAGLLKDKLNPNLKPFKYVELILKQSQRITEMVKNLLSFARTDKQKISTCYIPDIIDTSIAWIKIHLAKDGIKIETFYESDLPRIEVEKSHLEQVFINLLLNARDALNEKYPSSEEENKIITIKVKRIKKKGISYIRILFMDNGSGIEKECLDKIFNPFFTTKIAGKGTGLGLSICYRIIAEHKGTIEVLSQKNYRTCFIIDLPMEGKSVQSERTQTILQS